MTDDSKSSHARTDFGELSDAELVRATRNGSRRAYGALWKRHSASALKYARTLSPSDADDVVSEAFLKVYSAIQAGRGPEEDFRFYIRSAVRNTFVSMVRARRTAPAGEAIENVVGDRGAEVASMKSFDGSATARAFLSLPMRWQEVLWYTEVEGYTREQTAALLGMNPNAVSALSFRAREALRTAWLQEHISDAPSDLDRGCGGVTPLLGAFSRRGLSRRDRLRVEHHVNGCTRCTSVVDELSDLLTPGRLALILLPIAMAGGGFAAYATKVGAGSAVAASASGIAPPAAALVTVGSGGAAAGSVGGSVALAVVGKVAACALAATIVVPPAQLLLEATQHAPSFHAGSSAQQSEASAASIVEAVHAALVVHEHGLERIEAAVAVDRSERTEETISAGVVVNRSERTEEKISAAVAVDRSERTEEKLDAGGGRPLDDEAARIRGGRITEAGGNGKPDTEPAADGASRPEAAGNASDQAGAAGQGRTSANPNANPNATGSVPGDRQTSAPPPGDGPADAATADVSPATPVGAPGAGGTPPMASGTSTPTPQGEPPVVVETAVAPAPVSAPVPPASAAPGPPAETPAAEASSAPAEKSHGG